MCPCIRLFGWTKCSSLPNSRTSTAGSSAPGSRLPPGRFPGVLLKRSSSLLFVQVRRGIPGKILENYIPNCMLFSCRVGVA